MSDEAARAKTSSELVEEFKREHPGEFEKAQVRAARREAAEKYAKRQGLLEPYAHVLAVQDFKAGAEWEASRPVSDEEVNACALAAPLLKKEAKDAMKNRASRYVVDRYDDAATILEAFVAARRGSNGK